MQNIKVPFHFPCAISVKGSELFIESSKLLGKYIFLIHVEHIKKRQTWACKKIIPVKSHVVSHVKKDMKMLSPSSHFLTVYVFQGVPWKELNSGRSHFSFKFDFQSENELLFFNLNFEKKIQWRALRTVWWLCSMEVGFPISVARNESWQFSL